MTDPSDDRADQERLFALLRVPKANQFCFDCLVPDPTWASVTFGVFLCPKCAAAHHELGVLISFVRSTTLDTWQVHQLRTMKVGGNAAAATFFKENGGFSLLGESNQKTKYSSPIAQSYKIQLARRASNDAFQHPGKVQITEVPEALDGTNFSVSWESLLSLSPPPASGTSTSSAHTAVTGPMTNMTPVKITSGQDIKSSAAQTNVRELAGEKRLASGLLPPISSVSDRDFLARMQLQSQENFAKTLIAKHRFVETSSLSTPSVQLTEGTSFLDSQEKIRNQRMISSFKKISRSGVVATFLNKHNNGHDIYITHLDKTSLVIKILSFFLWTVIHAIGCALILWRVATSPYYFVTEDFEAPKLNSNHAWYMTPFHLAIDLFTWRIVWPLVRGYIVDDLRYRLRFGFRGTEIIFREPTGWNNATRVPLEDWRYQECWKYLKQAIEASRVYQGPALASTVKGFWTPDYRAAFEAYNRASSREIPEKTWDFSIWLRDGTDWFVWRIWRVYDKETIRKGKLMFQNRLRSLGKGSLYDQWQIMLDDDPTGSPLMSKHIFAMQELFEHEGINYYDTWSDIFAELDSLARIL